MKTLVVNLRKEPYDVYIGRAGKGQGGYFGNPFRVPHGVPRHRILDILVEYREWFLERVEREPVFRARVLALRGKRLGCFCKPGPCHGDVIAKWIDEQPVHGFDADEDGGEAGRLLGVDENEPNPFGWDAGDRP
jgi:hypothetical protein